MAEKESIWKKFLSKHWKMFAFFVVASILAISGAIYVFLWYVADAQAIGLVPETLGLWSIGYVVTFLIRLILWEVLFIIIPVFIFVVAIYYLWWKKLPDTERKEYKRKHLFGKKSQSRDGGTAISILINVFFIIKVYLDNNWNLAFAEWEFDYLIYSYLTALLWVAVIFGIPICLGIIWWINREMKKD
jgi:hypothetical protein